MALKTCIVCGAPSKYARCPLHRLRAPKPADRGLGGLHDRIKRQVIGAWVAEHGWVCPGWRRPPHAVPVGGLTGDHVIPRSVRPDLSYDPSNYGVLCQPCNSAKGNQIG